MKTRRRGGDIELPSRANRVLKAHQRALNNTIKKSRNNLRRLQGELQNGTETPLIRGVGTRNLYHMNQRAVWKREMGEVMESTKRWEKWLAEAIEKRNKALAELSATNNNNIKKFRQNVVNSFKSNINMAQKHINDNRKELNRHKAKLNALEWEK
jgi:hypothetical protein